MRNTKTRALLCLMFVLSGFCGLLYQTVWLRLSFAEFGVISPIVSVLVSVFMLGLGLGSFAGGRYAQCLKRWVGGSAITLYGLVETVIAAGALIVPEAFRLGGTLLGGAGEINSSSYLLGSALVIAAAILPFATAMGATYPVMLEFLKEFEQPDLSSFGFLYAANTAGALFGCLLTVFVLIELLGFRQTLIVAMVCNCVVALIAYIWAYRRQRLKTAPPAAEPDEQATSNQVARPSARLAVPYLLILFTTGFCSIGMEVVWIRSFAPLLGTVVYSFAILLAVYLGCNWLGACLYRLDLKNGRVKGPAALMVAACVTSCLPLIACNPDCFAALIAKAFVLVRLLAALSVGPISAVLGYLTPAVIDEFCLAEPRAAGRTYAVNIAGCILGPLLAGYLLMPAFGARLALVFLVAPLWLLAIVLAADKGSFRLANWASLIACLAVLLVSCFCTSWDEGGLYRGPNNHLVLHRDYAATTIALDEGGQKRLLVNGQGMTAMSSITKCMAHLPMMFNQSPSKEVLVICFGMGTTFRVGSPGTELEFAL